MRKHRTFLIPLARQLRSSSTDAELLLWRRLRDRQLDSHKFRRQFTIGPYIADLVCVERKLIVELDGGQHQEQEAQDRVRTHFLQERGYRVLRYWNDQALNETDSVLESILSALDAISA